ncbi:unnamed protein product [Effrenium voratum]|nr:unnamed protein product [Effrenium voratum]
MAWRLAATFLVSAVSADDVAVINLIRHGEKCDDSSSTGLTDIGKARAAYLARCMSQLSASDVTMPFGKATAVMASAVRDGKSTRPRDTAQPLADRLHLPLQMPCDKEDPDCFAQHARGLLSANGAVVVSWQHQDIPALVKALKVPHSKDFTKWPDDCDIESFSEPACIDKGDRCYDQVWQVRFYRPVGSEWQAEAMTSWQEGFANDTGCHENLQDAKPMPKGPNGPDGTAPWPRGIDAKPGGRQSIRLAFFLAAELSETNAHEKDVRFVNTQTSSLQWYFSGFFQALRVASLVGETVIHVIDDARQVRRDFFCKQTQLLEHMKYFETCLAGVSPDDEVEISVHCDIKVFEWLVEYMEGSREVSALDTKDLVSILISADFLQMETLVEECLAAMHKSLAEVLAVPLDLGCIPERLAGNLAARCSLEDLEQLQDEKDRFKSRLYVHQLKQLLSQPEHVLFCCAQCQRLCAASERCWHLCPEAVAGLPGDLKNPLPALLQHTPDNSWDVGDFFQQLWAQLSSWPRIFWQVWARLQQFECIVCHTSFCGLELGRCAGAQLDPKQAHVHEEGETGSFRDHVVAAEGQPKLQMLLRHREVLQDAEVLLKVATPIGGPKPSESTKDAEAPADSNEQLLRGRYCCDRPPEHGAKAAGTSTPRRRPRSAGMRTPRAESGLEYRLQRSPYQDASALQELFTEERQESGVRTPSFFEPKLPKGVASQRKLHHMMDMLRLGRGGGGEAACKTSQMHFLAGLLKSGTILKV